MERRGRKPGRRVDAKKLLNVLHSTCTSLIRGSGSREFEEIVVAASPVKHRPLIGETARKKFFNGSPISNETEKQFEAIFKASFDTICLDDCVEQVCRRMRSHLSLLENVYDKPSKVQAVAASLLDQIESDFLICYQSREVIEKDEIVDAALLAGELAGSLGVFPKKRNDKKISRIFAHGLELAAMALPYARNKAYAAMARLFHNEPVEGGSFWDDPEAILEDSQIRQVEERLRKAASFFETSAGSETVKFASQRICLARLYAKSAKSMLQPAMYELDAVRDIAEADSTLQAFHQITESLVDQRKGHKRKAVSKLLNAREIFLMAYGGEYHTHVAACDLRIAAIDASARPRAILDDAVTAVLRSPLNHVDVINLVAVKNELAIAGKQNRFQRFPH